MKPTLDCSSSSTGGGDGAAGGSRPAPGYNRRLRNYLAWCKREGIRPPHATADQVRAWLDSLHPSPSVRTHAQTALIAWFDWRMATKKDTVHNPSREIERVPVRRVTPRSLEASAADMVLITAEGYGPKWALYVGLMLYGGLRRAEACSLRWVDLEGGGRWLRVDGKGGFERMLPVHERLRPLIARWRSAGQHPV